MEHARNYLRASKPRCGDAARRRSAACRMATYSAGTTVGRDQTGAPRNRGRTGAATIDSFPIRQGIGAFRLFQRWHASWHGLCNRDDEPKQKLNQPNQLQGASSC
jgi:hypothetical protein